MLLRLPLRSRFGPSTFGVNSPFASIAPTNLQVVVAERGRVLLERPLRVNQAERPVVGGVGLAVGTVGERHRLELLVLLREDRAADARQAGLRQDLMPSILPKTTNADGTHRAGNRDVARTGPRVGGDRRPRSERALGRRAGHVGHLSRPDRD